MTNFESLSIADRFFILALDDQSGTFAPTTVINFPYGLAGALLADLSLKQRITLAKDHVIPVDATPIGDGLLDIYLAMIIHKKKPGELVYWIDRLAGQKTVNQVAAHLAEVGILCIKKARYLWIIPCDIYPPVNTLAKQWIRQHLRFIVLEDKPSTPADITLLSLLKACSLLELLFVPNEYEIASQKVDVLTQNEDYGKAVARIRRDIEIMSIAIANPPG